MSKLNETLDKLTLNWFKQRDKAVNDYLKDMIQMLIMLEYEVSEKNVRLEIISKSALEEEYLLYFKDELISKRIFTTTTTTTITII